MPVKSLIGTVVGGWDLGREKWSTDMPRRPAGHAYPIARFTLIQYCPRIDTCSVNCLKSTGLTM